MYNTLVRATSFNILLLKKMTQELFIIREKFGDYYISDDQENSGELARDENEEKYIWVKSYD